MINERDKDRLLQKSKLLLDKSEQEMDARDRIRLKQIREQVIEYGLPGRNRLNWLIPAGGISFAICAVLMGLLWQPLVPVLNPASELSDLDILVENESLEFYQNLDFYVWLEEEKRG